MQYTEETSTIIIQLGLVELRLPEVGSRPRCIAVGCNIGVRSVFLVSKSGSLPSRVSEVRNYPVIPCFELVFSLMLVTGGMGWLCGSGT